MFDTLRYRQLMTDLKIIFSSIKEKYQVFLLLRFKVNISFSYFKLLAIIRTRIAPHITLFDRKSLIVYLVSKIIIGRQKDVKCKIIGKNIFIHQQLIKVA